MNPILKDSDIAAYAVAMYGYLGFPAVKWDHYQADSPERPVCVGVSYTPDGDTVVAVRGTDTGYDWIFNLIAIPFDAGELGKVDSGFYFGVPETAIWLYPLLKGHVYVTGHSRGGPLSQLLAAELMQLGVKIEAVVCLGPARAGCKAFADFMRAVPMRLYQAASHGAVPFARDPVCDVPEPIPGWPYVHARELIELPVTISKAAWQDMKEFSIHFAPGYSDALKKQGL